MKINDQMIHTKARCNKFFCQLMTLKRRHGKHQPIPMIDHYEQPLFNISESYSNSSDNVANCSS